MATPYICIDIRMREYLRDLKGSYLQVLLCIALHYDGETSWPGVETISRESGLSRTTTISAIKHLEALGWITVKRTHRRVNVYRLTTDLIRMGNERTRRARGKRYTGASAETLCRLPYKVYLQTDHWREVRKTILMESGQTCKKCGTTERLHVHHKHYRYLGRELDHKDCLVTLCATCHGAAHGKEYADE